MTTNQTEQYNLTDDQIAALAMAFDKWLVETGKEYQPTAIQMASIVLGRLMVFTNHLKCFDTFQELMAEVVALGQAEVPTTDKETMQ